MRVAGQYPSFREGGTSYPTRHGCFRARYMMCARVCVWGCGVCISVYVCTRAHLRRCFETRVYIGDQ